MYNLHLFGRVAEWFNAPVLKTGVGASLPRVQIPALPPYLIPLKGANQAPFLYVPAEAKTCELSKWPHVQLPQRALIAE